MCDLNLTLLEWPSDQYFVPISLWKIYDLLTNNIPLKQGLISQKLSDFAPICWLSPLTQMWAFWFSLPLAGLNISTGSAVYFSYGIKVENFSRFRVFFNIFLLILCGQARGGKKCIRVKFLLYQEVGVTDPIPVQYLSPCHSANLSPRPLV